MSKQTHPMLNGDAFVFSGNAHPHLAHNIATQLGTTLGNIDVSRFKDGEVNVEIHEHVRGHHIYIVQPTHSPVNENLMELLIMIDAFKRSAVESITAVIPYYGYSRQDRRPDFARTPISSRLVADLLQAAGVDQAMTLDIHSGQQQGFFDIPMINMTAMYQFVNVLANKYNDRDLVIVSPDVGGVPRARAFAKQLDADLAIIDKRRPQANQNEVMNIIGDVNGCDCIIVDDMIDTAGTLCRAAKALKEHNANRVAACATHPVFSDKAYDNIKSSHLDEIVVADTIPQLNTLPYRVATVSVAPLIAETISRIRANDSVSELYQ